MAQAACLCLVLLACGNGYGQQVRLVSPLDNGVGRLEVYYNGQWGTVCDDDFDNTEAVVVCRQLGRYHSGFKPRAIQTFGYGTGQIWLDDVRCDGSELMLSSCTHRQWGHHDCTHHEDVGVICDERSISVKLNPGYSNGLLLVHHAGTWGTVCDDGFGQVEASVVCRTLGYQSGRVIVESVPLSAMTMWLDNVACSVRNTHLLDCKHGAWGKTDCGHDEAVSVECFSFAEGFSAARLVSSTNQPSRGTQGILELYYKQQWGRVCNTGFGAEEAAVVCRMLGYVTKASSVSLVDVTSPRPMVLDRVQCIGTEPSLNDCLHYPWNQTSCSSMSAVGVSCPTESHKIHLEPTGNILSVSRGQDISVTCVVDNSFTTPPVSPFIWIYNSQYYRGQIFRKTITSKSDSGNLTCSFKNGQASTFINVLYPPRIHLEPDRVDVAVGEDVHVLCVVDDANPSVTKFTWLHNGFLTTGPTFRLQNVSKSDRGELNCYADNGQNGMTPVRAGVMINVKYPPEIHLEPRQGRINVLRGSDVTVVCVVDDANPPVSLFMWNHNNDITYGQTFTKTNVSKSDSGRLYCTADNGEVTATVGSQIVVVYPPEIHLEPSVEILSVLPGGDVTIVCVVDDANPAVTSFTWNHNGIVSCGQNYTKENVSKYDPGSLSCTAANDEGNTTIRTTLAVVSVGGSSIDNSRTPALVIVAGTVAAFLILVLVVEIIHFIMKLNTTADQRLKYSESKFFRIFKRAQVRRQHNHASLPVPESRHVYTTVGLDLPNMEVQTEDL